MEKKLRSLFDFQRFQKNKRLEEVICQSQARYENALSDEQLDMVNAAGEIDLIGENDRDILMKELKENDE